MDRSDLERYVIETVHDDAENLMEIVDAVCRLYTVSNDLLLVRYILALLIESTTTVGGSM